MESEFELTQLWETDMIVQFPKISESITGYYRLGMTFISRNVLLNTSGIL